MPIYECWEHHEGMPKPGNGAKVEANSFELAARQHLENVDEPNARSQGLVCVRLGDQVKSFQVRYWREFESHEVDCSESLAEQAEALAEEG